MMQDKKPLSVLVNEALGCNQPYSWHPLAEAVSKLEGLIAEERIRMAREYEALRKAHIEQLERAQPAAPVTATITFDANLLAGQILMILDGKGDELDREVKVRELLRAFDPSVAAQGTDGLLEQINMLRGQIEDEDVAELIATVDTHDAALKASVREETLKEIDQARRIMNTLNFDKYLDAALAHPEKAAQPAPPLQGYELMETTDAQFWAEQFCERFGGDRELMVSWFASAIMVGYDKGRGVIASCGDELQSKLDRAAPQTEGKQP